MRQGKKYSGERQGPACELSRPLAEQLRDLGHKIVPSKGPNRHDRRKIKAMTRKEMERRELK